MRFVAWRQLAVHLFLEAGEELFDRERQVVVDVTGDDGADLGLPPNLLNPGQEQVQGHQDLGVLVVELVGQFAFGVQRIVHGRHGPEAEGRVVGDHHLGDVRQQHGDLVALFHPEGRKRPGASIDQGVQFPVGDALAHENQGVDLRIARGVSRKCLCQGYLFDIDLGRDPGLVRLVPNPLETHDALLSSVSTCEHAMETI